jgi:hypothetical protein
MNIEKLQKFTIDGLKAALPNKKISHQKASENNISQTIEDDKYQINAFYEFGKSSIDDKTGVDLKYIVTGTSGQKFEESVSIFTNYIEYDIKGAIEEFSKLDLPLIEYYFETEKNEDEIKYLESVFYNPYVKPAQVQGWKIVIGRKKEIIDNDFKYIKPEEAQDIFQALYQGINNQLFNQPEKYFIKNWLTRMGNKGMWADCRVNNQNWEFGKNLLLNYGQSWKIGTKQVSIKQNILLIPSSLDDMENGHETYRRIKEHADKVIKEQQETPKKKSWKFWK